MANDLSFHDARRILALLAHAPEGRIRFVDGGLTIEAFLAAAGAADTTEEGAVTVSSPAVGIFRKPTTEDGRSIGVVEAPRRVVSVETDLVDATIETLVEDGAFVEFGTPIAIVHAPRETSGA